MPKPIPFDFLLDYLPSAIVVRPAIGMFYVYFDGKIVLIFRKVAKNPQHNGLWIAAARGNHVSLKAEIPTLTDFVFDEDEAIEPNWLQLSDGHEDFEEAAIRICELVSAGDFRIGEGDCESHSAYKTVDVWAVSEELLPMHFKPDRQR